MPNAHSKHRCQRVSRLCDVSDVKTAGQPIPLQDETTAYAEAYGLTVVMPNGDVSFYTDMKHGCKYYTHIAQEIPRIAQEFLHVSGRREDSFIAGLSMGGYGALKIGLRESHAFRACAALSLVTDLHFLSAYDDLYDAILGADCPIPAQDDLFALATQHQNDAQYDASQKAGTEFLPPAL